MGVLFGLGHAELLEALCADDVAEGVLDHLGRVCDRQRERLVILRRADVGQRIDRLLAGKAVEIGQVQRPGHFAGTVRAEVHEDHAVAGVDRALGADDDRLDEFVRLVGGIARLDRVDGVGIGNTLAADDGVIALLDAVPALVTVHAPEAALDRGDARVAERFTLFLKLRDKAGAALGRDVAAVEEAVDENLFHAACLCHVEHRKDVLEVTVHTAGGEKSHHMQRFSICLGILDRLDVDRVFKELAGTDLLGDLRQDLEDDAARADVGVADLGIAHLSLGQTDVQTGGKKLGAGIVREELIEIGGFGLGDRVARGGRRDAEAVHDDKSCFFAHSGVVLLFSRTYRTGHFGKTGRISPDRWP